MKKGDYIAVGHHPDSIDKVRIFLGMSHEGLYICVNAGYENPYKNGRYYPKYTWEYGRELIESDNVEQFEKGDLVAVWYKDSVNKIPGIFVKKSGSYYLIDDTDGQPLCFDFCEKVNDIKNHDWRVSI